MPKNIGRLDLNDGRDMQELLDDGVTLKVVAKRYGVAATTVRWWVARWSQTVAAEHQQRCTLLMRLVLLLHDRRALLLMDGKLQRRIAGRIGGNARTKRLTPERRSEIARIAGRARWSRHVLGSTPIKHGTITGYYRRGCRCADCRGAMRVYIGTKNPRVVESSV